CRISFPSRVSPPPVLSSYPSLSSSYLPLSPSFFFTAAAPSGIYTLSLHDALPISRHPGRQGGRPRRNGEPGPSRPSRVRHFGERSEEHTSELQSRFDLVCRLLLEKKKTNHSPSRGRGGGRR